MGEGQSATGQADDHDEPAAQDWPAGIGETSVWPIVAAVGTGLLYVGAALFVLSYGRNALLPVWPGIVTFLAGVGLFLLGAFGWLYHGFVYHYWSRVADPHDRITLRTAMVLFLGTEVATFGAGFAYYFYIRVRPWPPGHIPHLLSSLVVINTALLVTSSVTLHLAHGALDEDNHDRFVRLTGLTIVLGVVFVAGQVYEYYEFVVKEGYTLTSGLFASAFFGLTGLHGLHVSLGVVVLSTVFFRGWYLDQFSADRMTSVSTASMYWHFVDAVWIVLVASLYVVGSLHWP